MDTAQKPAAPALPDWDYWLNTRPEREYVVTRANAADGYPNPLTPLSQDLVITCENRGAHGFFAGMMGVVEEGASQDPFMLAFYGYITINVGLIGDMGAAMPGTTRRRLHENYFGFDPDPSLPEPDAPPSRLRTAGDIARVGRRMVGAYRDFGPRVERVRAQVEASRPAATEPSNEELAAWLGRLFECASEAWILPMIGGTLASASLDAVRSQLGGSDSERTDLCNRLHTGIGGNESAEAGLVASNLARAAKEDKGLVEKLEGGAKAAEIEGASARFDREFKTALERFGYRAVSELEVSRPSWRQDPDQLLDSVRRELATPEGAGANTGEIRAEAEAEARERVGGAKNALLGRTLRITRKVLSLRENCKIPVVAAHDEVRRVLEIAAPRLAERGALPDPEAAPYLLGSELQSVSRVATGPARTRSPSAGQPLRSAGTWTSPSWSGWTGIASRRSTSSSSSTWE